MNAQNILDALSETASRLSVNCPQSAIVVQALRGVVARAQRFEAQEMKDDQAFRAGVREGWRESQEMDDRNQAFFYIMGCVKEEEMSPRTLKMAAEMKAEIENRKAE